jgi:cytochrome c-type biogenesis protein CcmF
MCFFTAPFEKMDGIFTDGTGLNEALKDPWMVMHPPLVFISYSAMAILFSCTADGKESGYADRLLTWQRISWFFLGLGILSGSIWAYRALGWGGYWAWDPIENAAFVPWLILCGYLHRKDRRGPSACILPFASACFGVFLARSGILKDQSAHAYTSGNISVCILLLLFLAAVLVFLIITGIKNTTKRKVKSGLKDIVKWLFFYSINVYAALIFLGTVFPLLFHITMPVSFYNIISVIFVFTYSLLLLIYDIGRLKMRFLPMLLTATALTAGITVLTGTSRLWAILVIWCCLLPLSLWLVSGIRPARLAYCLTHTGAILLIIGAISSSVLGKEVYILTGSDNIILQAEGVNISAEELSKKSMIIKTTPLQDILIKSSESMLSPQGVIIPYETKPFIWLFWCGSFILIFQPVLGQISAFYKKRKYKTPEPAINAK